ncbi:hypothetical protein FGRMN_5111 [Fusarium graminum]|nr:hypothetical protein FGRMN_5111 [Fusarium graminum]
MVASGTEDDGAPSSAPPKAPSKILSDKQILRSLNNEGQSALAPPSSFIREARRIHAQMAKLFEAITDPGKDDQPTTAQVVDHLRKSACQRNSRQPQLNLRDVEAALAAFVVTQDQASGSLRSEPSASTPGGKVQAKRWNRLGDNKPLPSIETPRDQLSRNESTDSPELPRGDSSISHLPKSPTGRAAKRARPAYYDGSATPDLDQSLIMTPDQSDQVSSNNILITTSATPLPHDVTQLSDMLATLEKTSRDEADRNRIKVQELDTRISHHQACLDSISNGVTQAAFASINADIGNKLRDKARIEKGRVIFHENKTEMMVRPEDIIQTLESYTTRLGEIDKDIAQLQTKAKGLKKKLDDEMGQVPKLEEKMNLDIKSKHQLEDSARALTERIKYFAGIHNLIELGTAGFSRLTELLADRDVSLLDLARQARSSGN